MAGIATAGVVVVVNENVVYSVMRKLAMQVAEFWVQFVRPAPFESVFILNGVRVKISIDEYKRADDTQPVGVRRVRDEDSWTCDRCGYSNNTQICTHCGHLRMDNTANDEDSRIED